MDDFGIRFSVKDIRRFHALQSLFAEVKADKESEAFREPEAWIALVPDDVKASFIWPTEEERVRWLAIRNVTPIVISHPREQLGRTWNFYSVFESLENGAYDLVACEMVADDMAEMRIEPHGYPYGGVGPLIALAESFGFEVLGVNECGRYETRERPFEDEELEANSSAT